MSETPEEVPPAEPDHEDYDTDVDTTNLEPDFEAEEREEEN